jgi:hypothetical protein
MKKIEFRNVFYSVFAIAVLGSASVALAEDQVGTLTQVEGEVKIFSHPSKTLSEGAPAGSRALYEGEYYEVQNAKVGDRVEQGNILRTPPTSKARVVFDNGDQFNVGPGTAYRVFWKSNDPAAGTQVNLMYGKLRGIVEKGGPRSKLQIKTKTAIMGVRGTDFFIAHSGKDNSTEVAIIRGAVEVKSHAAEAKPVEVKQGFSAEVAAPAPVAAEDHKAAAPAPASVEMRKTTQEELVGIRKSSEIKNTVANDSKQAEIVKNLETKAVKTVLNDIKARGPSWERQKT